MKPKRHVCSGGEWPHVGMIIPPSSQIAMHKTWVDVLLGGIDLSLYFVRRCRAKEPSHPEYDGYSWVFDPCCDGGLDYFEQRLVHYGGKIIERTAI